MEHTEAKTLNKNAPLFSEEINEIKFTLREIELCACILGGRSVKKIASLLSLSPKTVENYIHNITQKLGCNSRESIIDFLEQSNKSLLIKKHYISLLLQNNFERKIK